MFCLDRLPRIAEEAMQSVLSLLNESERTMFRV